MLKDWNFQLRIRFKFKVKTRVHTSQDQLEMVTEGRESLSHQPFVEVGDSEALSNSSVAKADIQSSVQKKERLDKKRKSEGKHQLFQFIQLIEQENFLKPLIRAAMPPVNCQAQRL